jgi:multimeric flavodoxin WrbA
MHILGISASPRSGGNTDFIIKEVLKSAKDSGASTEFLSMANKTVHPCKACEYCAEHKECTYDDDAEMIFEKMMGADGIVIGSPVYFGNIAAPLKALIDRERVLWHQEKTFDGKVGAAVAVAWKWGHFPTLASISGFLLTNKAVLTSIGGIPGLGLMVYADEVGEAAENAESIDEAHALGKRIVALAKKLGDGT